VEADEIVPIHIKQRCASRVSTFAAGALLRWKHRDLAEASKAHCRRSSGLGSLRFPALKGRGPHGGCDVIRDEKRSLLAFYDCAALLRGSGHQLDIAIGMVLLSI
jgi:hypothetical protein